MSKTKDLKAAIRTMTAVIAFTRNQRDDARAEVGALKAEIVALKRALVVARWQADHASRMECDSGFDAGFEFGIK